MAMIADEEIPKSIKIDQYTYSFKERKVNNYFAYRCKNRKCGVIISIDIVIIKIIYLTLIIIKIKEIKEIKKETL